LAEFTLNGANGDDFYDISLVDGYNLPLQINPTGGNGTCGSPGCTSNLNNNCPTALQVRHHSLPSRNCAFYTGGLAIPKWGPTGNKCMSLLLGFKHFKWVTVE
jgi:hypothetical protein